MSKDKPDFRLPFKTIDPKDLDPARFPYWWKEILEPTTGDNRKAIACCEYILQAAGLLPKARAPQAELPMGDNTE